MYMVDQNDLPAYPLYPMRRIIEGKRDLETAIPGDGLSFFVLLYCDEGPIFMLKSMLFFSYVP